MSEPHRRRRCIRKTASNVSPPVLSTVPITTTGLWPHRPRIVSACCQRLTPLIPHRAVVLESVITDVWSEAVAAVRRGKLHERGLSSWLAQVVPCVISRYVITSNERATLDASNDPGNAGMSDAEIAAKLGVTLDRYRDRLAAAKRKTADDAQVEKSADVLASIARAEVTLPDDDDELSSFADPEAQLAAAEERQADATEGASLKSLFATAMNDVLTPRERASLIAANDPANGNKTDADIAETLGITVERYRSYTSTARKKVATHFDAMLRRRIIECPTLLQGLTPRERAALDARLNRTPTTAAPALRGLSEAQIDGYAASARGKVMSRFVVRG
jgi:DNA-binding CsgD family transcriptional regulator